MCAYFESFGIIVIIMELAAVAMFFFLCLSFFSWLRCCWAFFVCVCMCAETAAAATPFYCEFIIEIVFHNRHTDIVWIEEPKWGKTQNENIKS